MKHTGISREEETELAVRYQRGDRAAGSALVQIHGGLIATRVRGFLGVAKKFAIPFEDMMQEGRLGFLKGVERFDPSRGNRLTTYAVRWVHHYVGDYVHKQSGLIRVPSYLQDDLLAGRLDEDDEKGIAARNARAIESVDRPVADDERSILSFAASTDASPEDLALDEERRRMAAVIAEKGLSGMAPKERDILWRRLMSDEPETLEEISASYGVTRERIRQIEAKAVARFRANVRFTITPEERTLLSTTGSAPRRHARRARARVATPQAAE